MNETKPLVGVLETMAGMLMFCLPKSEDCGHKRSCVQQLDCPLQVVRFGMRTFFFKPHTKLTAHSSETVLNAPSHTTFGDGFGIFRGNSLKEVLENKTLYLLERTGKLTAQPVPASLFEDGFEIELRSERGQLHLQERTEYSFEIHARAAVYVAQIGGNNVLWRHDKGIVSTENGATPEELRAWYDANYPQ